MATDLLFDEVPLRCVFAKGLLDEPRIAIKFALASFLQQKEAFRVLDEDLGPSKLKLVGGYLDRLANLLTSPCSAGVILYTRTCFSDQNSVTPNKFIETASIGETGSANTSKLSVKINDNICFKIHNWWNTYTFSFRPK